MIHEGKFRAIQKEFEAGLEVETLMETRMAHGSEEWEIANQYLQYLYGLMRAMFGAVIPYHSSDTKAIG